MSNLTAPDAPKTRTHEVRFCTILPSEHRLPPRATFRIDEVLSRNEILDILETARDIVGVAKITPLADQQLISPHTMFLMELSTSYDQLEIEEVLDLFDEAVNADYRHRQAQHQKQERQLLFSSR